MGPIELADVVGLDVALHVGRVLAEAFGRPVPRGADQAEWTKRSWGARAARVSTSGGTANRCARRRRIAEIPADLEDRMVLPMLNEAVAVLREGVVEDADLLDAGAIFGTGFAPFRGGPLQYARERGVRQGHLPPPGAGKALWRTISPRCRMEQSIGLHAAAAVIHTWPYRAPRVIAFAGKIMGL